MRRAALNIVAALVTLSLSTAAAAPQEKDVRGKVTAVSAESVTVDVNGQPMTFTVNTSTDVIARGAGTKAREAQKMTGEKPKLAEVVKVGDNVEVSYTESGGTLVAKVIRGGLPAATATSGMRETTTKIEGVVSEVTGTALTIKPSSGEAINFMVDRDARFTGTGLGTMAKEKAAEAKKLVLTDVVAVGDTVEVTYKAMGDMKHATAVRVVTKGK